MADTQRSIVIGFSVMGSVAGLAVLCLGSAYVANVIAYRKRHHLIPPSSAGGSVSNAYATAPTRD